MDLSSEDLSQLQGQMDLLSNEDKYYGEEDDEEYYGEDEEENEEYYDEDEFRDEDDDEELYDFEYSFLKSKREES